MESLTSNGAGTASHDLQLAFTAFVRLRSTTDSKAISTHAKKWRPRTDAFAFTSVFSCLPDVHKTAIESEPDRKYACCVERSKPCLRRQISTVSKLIASRVEANACCAANERTEQRGKKTAISDANKNKASEGVPKAKRANRNSSTPFSER